LTACLAIKYFLFLANLLHINSTAVSSTSVGNSTAKNVIDGIAVTSDHNSYFKSLAGRHPWLALYLGDRYFLIDIALVMSSNGEYKI